MGIEVLELSRNLMMFIVSGQLTQLELAEAQRQAAASMSKMDRVRIIVIAEDFRGWEKGGQWDDMSFQAENDGKVERMAIVGDKKWKELVLTFVGQGLREFPIEYFEHGQLAKARSWVLGS
jgi:hypothetical protein